MRGQAEPGVRAVVSPARASSVNDAPTRRRRGTASIQTTALQRTRSDRISAEAPVLAVQEGYSHQASGARSSIGVADTDRQKTRRCPQLLAVRSPWRLGLVRRRTADP